jgi:hypothetical protein
MLLNILNNKQKKELLKLVKNEFHVPKDLDITPLDLIQEVVKALLKMHEVAKALLIFEASDQFDYNILNSYDVKNDLECSIRKNLINCIIDPEHFICHMDAMDYLREADWSLSQSFEIAKEYGLLRGITSITLANLLYNQKQNEIIETIDFDYIIETIIKNQ